MDWQNRDDLQNDLKRYRALLRQSTDARVLQALRDMVAEAETKLARVDEGEKKEAGWK